MPPRSVALPDLPLLSGLALAARARLAQKQVATASVPRGIQFGLSSQRRSVAIAGYYRQQQVQGPLVFPIELKVARRNMPQTALCRLGE